MSAIFPTTRSSIPNLLPSAILEALPAAIYTTDAEGRLTYFNSTCVEFSGRVPKLGTDEWCVTWKLYSFDGSPLPHSECPMAVALKERRWCAASKRLPSGPTAAHLVRAFPHSALRHRRQPGRWY